MSAKRDSENKGNGDGQPVSESGLAYVRRYRRNVWIAMWVGMASVVAVVYLASPMIQGSVAALVDAVRGHDVIYVFSMPIVHDGAEEFAEILSKKGIEVRLYGTCVVHDYPYVDGYNAVAHRVIARKHGRNYLAETWGQVDGLR